MKHHPKSQGGNFWIRTLLGNFNAYLDHVGTIEWGWLIGGWDYPVYRRPFNNWTVCYGKWMKMTHL
jgi:hypothetical protein